jgi:hypothetical protein
MEEVDETDGPERSVRLAGASQPISTEEEQVSPKKQGDGAQREADAQEEIDNGAVDEESVDGRGVEEEYHPGAGTSAQEESDSMWKDGRKREWSELMLTRHAELMPARRGGDGQLAKAIDEIKQLAGHMTRGQSHALTSLLQQVMMARRSGNLEHMAVGLTSKAQLRAGYICWRHH